MELPIIETKVCLKCGASFKINAKQRKKKYCDNCKKIHTEEYRKRYYNQVVKPNRKPKRHYNYCKACGEKFVVGSGRPPTKCIDCLSKSKNAIERERAYYRRDYTQDPEQIRVSG